MTSSTGSFGNTAGEAPLESEVEVAAEGASASAGDIPEPGDPAAEPDVEPGPRVSAEPGDARAEESGEIAESLDGGVQDGPDARAEDGALPEPSDAEQETEAEPETDIEGASSLEAQLAERTTDLQRLQAEFLNYKRRVDRDRVLIAENATYKVLQPIVEVLDTIDRAREHGELEGGFKAVAEQLERIVAGLGLVRFGAPGDAFDPTIHEALSHIGEDPDVEVTTAKVVAKAGYKINDRVVRAAQVLVVDPVDNG